MTSLPNPWITDSTVELPSSVDTAAAPDTSPESTGVAAGPPTDSLGSEIGDIHELFFFARLLVANARINPDRYAPEAVAVAEEIRAQEQAYYDPSPLFLRRAG